jgi:hypothetical protein
VHAVGDDHALAPNASAVSDLLDLRVDEQVGVAALQRPGPERLDLLVQAGAILLTSLFERRSPRLSTS